MIVLTSSPGASIWARHPHRGEHDFTSPQERNVVATQYLRNEPQQFLSHGEVGSRKRKATRRSSWEVLRRRSIRHCDATVTARTSPKGKAQRNLHRRHVVTSMDGHATDARDLPVGQGCGWRLPPGPTAESSRGASPFI